MSKKEKLNFHEIKLTFSDYKIHSQKTIKTQILSFLLKEKNHDYYGKVSWKIE